MWDLGSDDGRTTAHEHAETPDEKAMRWPQEGLMCVFKRKFGMEKET